MLFDADPETGLAWHQATRIQSLCKAARQYVREIRRCGHDGQAEDGSRCAPLPPEEWEPLTRPLGEIARVAEETGMRAGGKSRERTIRPVSSTRAAISGRLAMLEEVAADLKPRKFEPAYGALPEEMKSALEDAAAAIDNLVSQARAALAERGEDRGADGG